MVNLDPASDGNKAVGIVDFYDTSLLMRCVVL